MPGEVSIDIRKNKILPLGQEAVAGGQHQKICIHVLLPGRSIIDHAIWLQLPNRALASISRTNEKPGM